MRIILILLFIASTAHATQEEITTHTMSITDGIIVGGAGGAIAGLMIMTLQLLRDWVSLKMDSRRVWNWLKENTKDEADYRFRSTRTIASWNNLTQERVRYVCSVDSRIHLSVGGTEDMWSIYDSEGREEVISQGFVRL